MADLDQLLAAIHESPDDVVARLVYADLLLERGDPLGELIHVDCAIAMLPPFSPERSRLAARRTEIFDAHLRDGFLDWWRWEQMFPRFRYGFIEGLHYAQRCDMTDLDADLERLYEMWSNRTCRCGMIHDPLMWISSDRKFPLVRRIGGIPMTQVDHWAPPLAARKILELRVIGDGDWRLLASFTSLQALSMSAATTTARFQHVLALPKLVELAFDRSTDLALRMVELGIPRTLRIVEIEPAFAQPLRDALVEAKRPFVENAAPTGDEFLLVTDAKRAHDLAFIDRPILADDPLVPYELDAAVLAKLVRAKQPRPSGWHRRGRILVELGHPQVAVSSRAQPVAAKSGDEVGVTVTTKGPMYVRVENLVPKRPLLGVWRVDTKAENLKLMAGGDYIDAPLPTPDPAGPTNWVFVIPAPAIRDTSVQLTLYGLQESMTFYTLWYFQPAT